MPSTCNLDSGSLPTAVVAGHIAMDCKDEAQLKQNTEDLVVECIEQYSEMIVRKRTFLERLDWSTVPEKCKRIAHIAKREES
jgi:hypothetical protein